MCIREFLTDPPLAGRETNAAWSMAL